MKRSFLLGLGLFSAAVVTIPGTVLAQDFPPPPPATYYGSISGSGVAAGQGVVAIVVSGNTSTICGTGSVVDASGLHYVVDVVTNDQTAGCGQAGRTVRFYVTPPNANTGGSLAVESPSWAGAGPHLQNLTTGSPLTKRAVAPTAAKD